MKKYLFSVLICFLVILMLPSCNYNSKNAFISDLSQLTTEKVLSDNQCNINNSANKICMYGNYFIKICDNSNNSINDICVTKSESEKILLTYEIGQEIIGICPVDNKTICYLTIDDTMSYYCLNLETGNTKKIIPPIKNDHNIRRIYPYFINDIVYIIAVVEIEGQAAPSLYIYKCENNNYVKIAQYCTQIQIAEKKLFFSTDNCKITKTDENGQQVVYDNNHLDDLTSLLVGNKILHIDEGIIKLTDIESRSTKTYSVGDIATANTTLIQAIICDNILVYADANAVYVLNLSTSEIKKICDYPATDISLLNDKIFFTQNGSLHEIKIR